MCCFTRCNGWPANLTKNKTFSKAYLALLYAHRGEQFSILNIMNFALLVPASDEVGEVGALRHLFDETPLKAPQPAEPSCPSQAVTIKLGGRSAARRALGWVRRARLSKGKGARGGWTRGRGGSRDRWGCDGAASTSPAGGSAGAAGFRRGVVLRTLPIRT